jgi:RNA polymerase sigma-70 factor (ECF subfamily)
VQAAVRALPEGLREALLLTRLEGMTAAEAGQILGCSAEAVRARVCRARTLLAQRLSSERKRQ